eukprot:365303-Chlamydomonas_euryale.AAC.51
MCERESSGRFASSQTRPVGGRERAGAVRSQCCMWFCAGTCRTYATPANDGRSLATADAGRYFSFVSVNNAQDEAKVFPVLFNEETIKQEDMYIVELDLTAIDPNARTATFLLELVLGGILEHETDTGVLDLDGNSLVIKIGHQSLLFDSGDAVADQSVSLILEDVSPL